jgi:RNA polymerase sigma-B factor
LSVLSASTAPARVDEVELEDLLIRLHACPAGTPEHRRLRESAIALGLPLAVRVAARYRNHGEPGEDLCQVAAVALVQAVDGYRPGEGPCFLAYAMPTILGALRRHFRDYAWNVRVPRRLQELRLRIIAAEQSLAQQLYRPPTPVDLAAALDVAVPDVLEALHAAEAYRALSLEAPTPAGRMIGDAVGTVDAGFEAAETHVVLRQALDGLPSRLRHIVVLRFAQGLTQAEIAEAVGISQMHVSRLLAQALQTLRRHFDPAGDHPVAIPPQRRRRERPGRTGNGTDEVAGSSARPVCSDAAQVRVRGHGTAV